MELIFLKIKHLKVDLILQININCISALYLFDFISTFSELLYAIDSQSMKKRNKFIIDFYQLIQIFEKKTSELLISDH